MNKKARRDVEINDLMFLLGSDQRVKTFNRWCIDANPGLIDKATVEYMECQDLKRIIDCNNRNEIDDTVPKIMVLDQLEPICKTTQFAVSN